MNRKSPIHVPVKKKRSREDRLLVEKTKSKKQKAKKNSTNEGITKKKAKQIKQLYIYIYTCLKYIMFGSSSTFLLLIVFLGFANLKPSGAHPRHDDEDDDFPVLVVDDTPGNGDYVSIQEAIDAADPGVTIIIKEHSSRKGWQVAFTIKKENITLIGEGKPKATKNLIIKELVKSYNGKYKDNAGDKKKDKKKSKKKGVDGNKIEEMLLSDEFLTEEECSKVYLDGCDAITKECGQSIFTVASSGVSIENFFIRHGHIVLTDDAHNAKIADNCLLGDHDNVIRPREKCINPHSSTRNGLLIERNIFQGGDSASILLDGDGHTIRHNIFATVDIGIEVVTFVPSTVEGSSIIGNAFFGCKDTCISIGTETNNFAIVDNTNTLHSNSIQHEL